MNPFALSGLLTFASSLAFGIFSWVKGKRLLNKIWAIFNLSVAIWGFGAFKFSTTLDKEAVFFWLRVGHIGVVLIPVLFVHFVFELLGIKRRKVLVLTYVIGALFFILNITDWLGITKLFITNLRFVFNSFYVDSPPAPLYPVFVTFFFGSVIYGHLCGIKALKTSMGQKRVQIKYFLAATTLGFTGGATAFPMVFGINLYPFLHFTVPLYPLVMTYAIIKYRLMDIEVAIERTAIFLVTQSFVIGIPLGVMIFGKPFLSNIFADKWWIVPLVTFGVLAETSSFTNTYLQQRFSAGRFQKIHDIQESLESSGRGMIEIDNIHRLARIIPRYLTMFYLTKLDIDIEHATIFLFDGTKKKFILESSAGKYKLEKGKEFALDHPFNIWFTEKRKLLLEKRIAKRQDIDVLRYDDIGYWMYNNKAIKGDDTLSAFLKRIRHEMDDLNSVICVPSYYKGDLMGFLLLGSKSTGMYNQEELDIFSRLATNAAAAFRSAQLSEKLMNAQTDLIAMERFAAVGRLAASAKHEISNPLNTVSGSMQQALMYINDMENNYQRLRERLIPILGDVKEFILPRRKELRLESLADDLFALDETLLDLEQKGKADDDFRKTLDARCRSIVRIQEKLEETKDNFDGGKQKGSIDDTIHRLETIKINLEKIKNSDKILAEMLNRGLKRSAQIAKVINSIYHLPKETEEEFGPIKVKDLIDESFEFARYQTYWENLTDTTRQINIPEDLPKIGGYMNRLVSVFSNLIINAYQAMTDAGIKETKDRVIRINAAVMSEDESFVKIRFANKGTVIPQENLERIFDRDFTTKGKGRGLGLHISKTQVEVFNKGSIYVHNIDGFGPEFVVKLPIWREG